MDTLSETVSDLRLNILGQEASENFGISIQL